MIFTIAGKEYQLKFGVRFLREMDKIHTDKFDGMEFGFGMEKAVMYLATRNPLVLVDIIKSATAHEEIVKTSDIEQAIEEYAAEHGMEQLFIDIEEALGKSTWTANKVKQFKEKAKIE